MQNILLGIIYTLSGSLSEALAEGRTNGLVAYFLLKSVPGTQSFIVKSLFHPFSHMAKKRMPINMGMRAL